MALPQSVTQQLLQQCRFTMCAHQQLQCRFHEVEPQKNLHVMAPPQVISQQLLRRNHALIPYPALSEKTLVLAEYAVVGTADTPDNQLSLMARWD